jgi:hypothetical protein
MASSAKPRQPRLRASCDGCFLAKVKCSKARPICSRCLACGLECHYSPSSRAGKPKSDNSSGHSQGPSPADMTDLSPMHDDKSMVFSTHPAAASLYKIETGWHTPPSLDGSMSRNPSIGPNFAMAGVDERSRREHEAAMGLYGVSMPWSPSAPLAAAPYDEMAMAGQLPPHHGRSASMDASMAGHMMPAWADTAATHEMMYGSPTSLPTPASMGSSYFPSPSSTPTLQPRHKPGQCSAAASSSSCTCFTVCLQSLQQLHNHSSPAAPAFDLVLSLNRKAVEGCAAMLACPRCMNRSGAHTSVMLLGTIIGKITSFYKNATQTYFDFSGNGSSNNHGAAMMPSHSSGPMAPATGLGVSLGAYTLGGEEGRWLELQILERELRKLEEVYAQFREMCADLSEDAEVSRAMIGYLNNTLGSTLDVVGHRKGEVRYT